VVIPHLILPAGKKHACAAGDGDALYSDTCYVQGRIWTEAFSKAVNKQFKGSPQKFRNEEADFSTVWGDSQKLSPCIYLDQTWHAAVCIDSFL